MTAVQPTDTGAVAAPPTEHLPTGFSDRLYNDDLAPAEDRDWGVYSLFCMWMADVHSIGGYTLAAGLFFLGLNGWWVLAGLGVAIIIVLGLMNRRLSAVVPAHFSREGQRFGGDPAPGSPAPRTGDGAQRIGYHHVPVLLGEGGEGQPRRATPWLSVGGRRRTCARREAR